MLNTKPYKNHIIELFESGKTITEIQKILEFKYVQPIYNLLYKYVLIYA